MSRSGYQSDWDGGGSHPELYRNAVDNAIGGKRGQKFLRELAVEMDSMEAKELIAGALVTEDGECCAMGVICKARKILVDGIDETDSDYVADLLGIAPSMAKEIAYENDEFNYTSKETPSQRWVRMRKWVADHLRVKP